MFGRRGIVRGLMVLMMTMAILFVFRGESRAQLVERGIGYAFEEPGFLDLGSALAYDFTRHRLAIADKGRNLVYIFDLSDQTWQTLGRNNELAEPISISFSPAGDLYALVNEPLALIFHMGNDFPDTLNLPAVDIDRVIHPTRIYISVDSRIYLAEKDQGAIYIIDEAGSILKKLTSELKNPDGILVRKSGELVVADRGIDPVLIFGPDGKFIRRLSRPEAPTAQFSFSASGLAQDQRGWIYTLDITRSRVVWYDPTGLYQDQWAPPPPFYPADIAIDKFDNIYILESASGRVSIFNRSR